MDYSPPSSSVHGNSPGKNTGVGCHALLQGIFPTQVAPALEADFLPCEPPGKPKNTGVGSLSLPQGIFLTQELNRGLLHCSQILYQPSYQGSPTNKLTSIKEKKKKKVILLSLDFIKLLFEPHIQTSHYSHTHSPDTLSQYTPTASTEHIYYISANSTEAIV